MAREILPTRRPSENFDFDHASDRGAGTVRYTATVGYNTDGQIAEVFLNSSKLGSDLDIAARDSAIAASIGLQFGVPMDTLRCAVTRNADGTPASPLGRLLDLLQAA